MLYFSFILYTYIYIPIRSVAEILTIAMPLEAMLHIHPPPSIQKSDNVHQLIQSLT